MIKNTVLIFILNLAIFDFSFSQETNVAYYEYNGNCRITKGIRNCVINTADDFYKITGCRSPDLNLDLFTMIIIQGTSPGHYVPQVSINIVKDSNTKTYYCETKCRGGEPCYCRVMKPGYRRIIYIPKIEEDYQFSFSHRK